MRKLMGIVGIFVGLALAGCAGLDVASGGTDADLASAALDRLAQDSVVGRLPVGVRVDQGVATVSGALQDAGARARALSIVRGTPGMRGVVDDLTH